MVMSGWPWWPADELVSTEPDHTSGVWGTNHSLGLRDKNTETKVRSNEWARCCSHKKALNQGLTRPWDPFLCSECLWSKRQWDPQCRRLVTRPGHYRKGDFSIQVLWLGRWTQIKGKPSPWHEIISHQNHCCWLPAQSQHQCVSRRPCCVHITWDLNGIS